MSVRVAPEILPPAFYPVSLNLVGRRCVVIGVPDDREAIEKDHDLREVGADVVWLQDPAAVTEGDVADAFFVLSTPQDATLSAWLRELSERHRFLLCTIDQPAFGFVAMQAIVKAGRARLGISTGGVAPRVGGALKAALQRALDETFIRFLECLAHQRRLNRARNPGSSADRRATMMKASEGFTVDVRVTYPQWFLDELAAQRPTVVAD
jgi:siroheme synthase (precorrin-2 oxidase/ferrochelatase)